jgi:cytochrome c oxidase subunit III
METTNSKKIHPHKFSLWIAMASIIMAFAGLISAYLVKMSQSNWLQFNLPAIFTLSTIVIIASSATMYFAVRAFKQREIPTYRLLITITAVLGIVFMALQIKGFFVTDHAGVKIVGKGANASGSFLLAIAGLHILHVLGGVIVLIVQFFRAFSRKNRIYSAVPVEVAALYWHFVDVLWIVLFIFFWVAKN